MAPSNALVRVPPDPCCCFKGCKRSLAGLESFLGDPDVGHVLSDVGRRSVVRERRGSTLMSTSPYITVTTPDVTIS